MQLKPEFVWMAGLALAVLAILVASDFHKKWLVRRAQATGSRIQKSWLANTTDWCKIALLCIGFVTYLAFVNYPQLIPRKLPRRLHSLEPLREWFFKKPPNPQSEP